MADLGNVAAFETVVGTHRQIEFFNRRIEDLGRNVGLFVQTRQFRFFGLIKVRDNLAVPFENLRRLAESFAGVNRAIAPNFHYEAVIVRLLADAGMLDHVVNTRNWSIDSIYRDNANRHILAVVRRAIAGAVFDCQFHIQAGVGAIQRCNRLVGINDFN